MGAFLASQVVLFTYGVPALRVMLQRPATRPSAEEYAAISGFLDDFFKSTRSPYGPPNEVHVITETVRLHNPGAMLPLDVVSLGSPDMGFDFYRQNSYSWRWEPRFTTRRRVRLVPNGTRSYLTETSASYTIPNPDCAMRLSRLGFSKDRQLALLRYTYVCGPLCCSSGWVLLHKAGDNWHIQKFGSGRLY
jgi:hypothetical protein